MPNCNNTTQKPYKVAKKRLYWAFSTLFTLCLGLFVRYKLWAYLPYWINIWIGDAIWATMIFFAFQTVFYRLSPYRSAWIVTIICIVVEFSQLYQAEWINAVRATTLGGLAIGHGFLWSDLVATTLGVWVGYGTFKAIQRETITLQ